VASYGNFRASNFTVAGGLDSCDDSSLGSLVVGGDQSNVNFTGSLECGSLLTDSSSSSSFTALPSFTNGQLSQGNLVDIASTFNSPHGLLVMMQHSS
jgi:hypothetical protein